MTHDVVVAGTGNAAHCAAREGGASVLLLEKTPESQRDGISPPKSNWAQKLDNHPGGAGLMAGSVFGKGAGESAAADIGAKAT